MQIDAHLMPSRVTEKGTGESTESYGCALLVRNNRTGQIYLVIMMTTWYYFFCDSMQILQRWSKPEMAWL